MNRSRDPLTAPLALWSQGDGWRSMPAFSYGISAPLIHLGVHFRCTDLDADQVIADLVTEHADKRFVEPRR